MKLRLLILCSVLVIALVWLYLTSPREQRSNLPRANINTPVDSEKEMCLERLTKLGTANNNARPVTSNESQHTDESQSNEDCLASGEALLAGDIKVVSVKGRKGNSAYPQIAGPRTPQEQKFNLYVQKLFARDLYDFSVSYATPEFLSIDFVYELCGASCHYPSKSLNYDLKAGKPIKRLAEIFKPGLDPLKTIASYCVSELRRCEGFFDKDDWFVKGTKPTESNYDTWSLQRNGVSITFVEYQIAPGVYPGATVLVPYSHLQGMLRKDVEWFRRLQPNNEVRRDPK